MFLHGDEGIRNYVTKTAERSWLVLVSFRIPLFRYVGLHLYGLILPRGKRSVSGVQKS